MATIEQYAIVAYERVEAYLSGEIDMIEEYEIEQLDHVRAGTRGKMPHNNEYSSIASPNIF